jgi:hypothetical protein
MDNFDDADPIPDMDDTTDGNHYQVLMKFLQDNDTMKKAALGSLRQGLMCGGGAVTGGLILGPVGGLVGGIAGSIYSYYTTPNYDGIVQHMITMEDMDKRNQLLRSIRLCLLHAGANAKNFSSPQDFQQVLYQFTEQRGVRDQIWKACMDATAM